jgi:hypothetical protein
MTEPSTIVDTRPPRQLAHFLVTKQHRRFIEFADAVRRQPLHRSFLRSTRALPAGSPSLPAIINNEVGPIRPGGSQWTSQHGDF